MPRRRPRSPTAVLFGVLLPALLFAAGCSDEPLPAPGPILERSAQAMGELTSVRFEMDIDGPVTPLALQTVTGVLTSAGDAEGSFQTLVGEDLLESDFVLAGEDLWVRQSTGPFQKVPASFAATVYDPHVLLRPEQGLPAVLAGAGRARTRAVERVAGVRTHRITADVTTELIEGLTHLEAGQERVPAILWVSIDDARVIRTQVDFRTRSAAENTRLTLTLSAFDEPVEVRPPTA
jgi:lipoprotein LprG